MGVRNGALCAAAALGAALSLGGVGTAVAQDYDAEVRKVAQLVTATVTIGTGAAAFSDTRGFTGDEDDSHHFFGDDYLHARYGARYVGNEAVRGVVNFRGVPVVGEYIAGTTTLRITAPTVPNYGAPTGQPYIRQFTGATRQASYLMMEEFFDFDISDEEAFYVASKYVQSLARYSPIDPLAGNPDSLQGLMVRTALEIAEGGSAIEGGAQTAAKEPFIVGLAIAQSTSGGYETTRISGRMLRQYHLFEGKRALLKLDTPFNVTTTEGARSYTVSPAIALELPLIERRWSLEPRVSLGVTSSEIGSTGAMTSATLTSRLRFDVGRGMILIGNTVGHVGTFSLGDDYIDPDIQNTVFRNAIAYEYPLKSLVFSRNATVRASYAYTNLTGTPLFLNKFHEVTVSFGVRNREGDPRNTPDLFRLNVNATFGKDYSSGSLGLGYRF